MRQDVVALTTRPDRHGRRIAPDSLDPVAAKINDGPRLPLLIEHDKTIPPLGKVVAARVEDRSDGERQLIYTEEHFPQARPLSLHGSTLLVTESASDRRPFKAPEPVEIAVIGADLVNFDSESDRQLFLDEVRQATAEPFETQLEFRYSYIPDPELVITAAKALAATLLGKKLLDVAVDAVGEKVKQDFGRLYDLVRAAVVSFARRAVPKNRPITYVLPLAQEAGQPVIEFVAVTTSPSAYLSAITLPQLLKAVARAHDLHATIPASKIQFLLAEDGTWQFNYLLSTTGAVIGTDASFRRQARRLAIYRAGGVHEMPAGRSPALTSPDRDD
jgi:hypothetical protein